jgi:NDP-4-keto-2,6-dideoxyhexose 3-C-methyltransferase
MDDLSSSKKANLKPNESDITARKTCRLCYSDKIVPVFSLGEQYVNDFVDKGVVGIKAPLELILCENCSLLQLKHTAPQELLYARFYWYHSGFTNTIRNDLKQITEVSSKMVNLKPGDVVLDIGANDGTLLSNYQKGVIRVGCEPANNLVEELKNNCDHVIHDFWTYDSYNKLGLGKKAKVITAIGMFYDMEDPNQFVGDAAKALADDGIFVAQLMCLKNMLENNDVGNICHEHLEYYSLEALRYLFEKNGLEIFKVEENAINGGSYRLLARHYKNGSIPMEEKFTKKDYMDFYKRIEENKKLCVDFIKQEVKKGKKIYVYGASTKGNVILQYYGLTPDLIVAAAEKSKDKIGKYTIGTMIPIVDESDVRDKADYFFVLPYSFLKEFMEKEKDWRAKGGKFIVPLPNFRVV